MVICLDPNSNLCEKKFINGIFVFFFFSGWVKTKSREHIAMMPGNQPETSIFQLMSLFALESVFFAIFFTRDGGSFAGFLALGKSNAQASTAHKISRRKSKTKLENRFRFSELIVICFHFHFERSVDACGFCFHVSLLCTGAKLCNEKFF